MVAPPRQACESRLQVWVLCAPAGVSPRLQIAVWLQSVHVVCKRLYLVTSGHMGPTLRQAVGLSSSRGSGPKLLPPSEAPPPPIPRLPTSSARPTSCLPSVPRAAGTHYFCVICWVLRRWYRAISSTTATSRPTRSAAMAPTTSIEADTRSTCLPGASSGPVDTAAAA